MKRFIAFFLSLIVVFSLFPAANASAAANEVQTGTTMFSEEVLITVDAANEDDADIPTLHHGSTIAVNIDIDDYRTASPRGPVPSVVSTQFKHTIVDANGSLVAYFTSTVTGNTAQYATGGGISSVSGYFSNAGISGLTYSVVYGYNCAYVYVYLHGVNIVKAPIKYCIDRNGTIFEG